MIKLLDILFEIKKIETDRKSVILGVKHYDKGDMKQVMDYIKANFSPDDKVVFSGEGGDPNNKYPTNSEGDILYPEIKKYFKNLVNDSWDGKDFDVTDPSSYMFGAIQSMTGLDKITVQAAVYTHLVGEGQDKNEIIQLLTPKGIEWIKSFGIKNPENPDAADKQLMYDLCFPEDSGLPEQDLSKATDAFNKARDINLVKKIKQYESQGYRVIALAGESHIDLINAL